MTEAMEFSAEDGKNFSGTKTGGKKDYGSSSYIL
jgi:hypothetical protein